MIKMRTSLLSLSLPSSPLLRALLVSAFSILFCLTTNKQSKHHALAFTTPDASIIGTFTTMKLNRYSFFNLKNHNDFDDLASLYDDEEDGKELAKEFYKFTKEKDKKFKGRRGEIDSSGTPSAGLFASGSGSVYAFPNKKVTISSTNNQFKGRRGEIDASGTPSAGLFAGRGRSGSGTVYAYPNNSNSTSKRSAYTSTSTSSSRDLERTVQAILVLLLLGFTIYIGSTGDFIVKDANDQFVMDAVKNMESMINDFNAITVSVNVDVEGMINEFNTNINKNGFELVEQSIMAMSIDLSSLINDASASASASATAASVGASEIVKEAALWF